MCQRQSNISNRVVIKFRSKQCAVAVTPLVRIAAEVLPGPASPFVRALRGRGVGCGGGAVTRTGAVGSGGRIVVCAANGAGPAAA